MAIYDCFQYFNEDHIVDLRLNILDKFVDHFIISESTKTHQGKDKKINFDKNNKLKKLFLYDEDESIDVSMSSLETKHSGKKLTFLQQIFGNIGVGSVGRGTIIGSGKADN